MYRITHSNLLGHLPATTELRPPFAPYDPAATVEPPSGKHLILDLSFCNDRVLNGQDIALYAAQCVELLGMQAYGSPWVQHFGHASPLTSGHTLFQPMGTSAITGRFVDGNRTAHLDVFSCRDFDDDAAVNHAEHFFGAHPARTVVTVFHR